MPSVLVNEKYKSEDDCLDTYFRLLRTDCFYNLTTGVRKFVGGELDHMDMSVYRSVTSVRENGMLNCHCMPVRTCVYTVADKCPSPVYG